LAHRRRIAAASPPHHRKACGSPVVHADQIAEMTKRFNQRLGNVVCAGRIREEMTRVLRKSLVEPGSCRLRGGGQRSASAMARTRPTLRWTQALS
jgi:hypothetical protein